MTLCLIIKGHNNVTIKTGIIPPFCIHSLTLLLYDWKSLHIHRKHYFSYTGNQNRQAILFYLANIYILGGCIIFLHLRFRSGSTTPVSDCGRRSEYDHCGAGELARGASRARGGVWWQWPRLRYHLLRPQTFTEGRVRVTSRAEQYDNMYCDQDKLSHYTKHCFLSKV